MDAVATRIRAGDVATPDLLELATHRLTRRPDLAQVLAVQARGAQRERAMAALRSGPERAAALAGLALLRETRRRIMNERAFYRENPDGVVPAVHSSRG